VPRSLPAGASSGLVGGAAAAPAAAAGGDDEEVDLWGDEDDDPDAEEENEKRLAAIADAHKAKKAAAGKLKTVIAKSSVVLDVKPWDDETDLGALEAAVRAIVVDGLDWQASQLEDIGYGIKKLRIMCQIEDDKISVDDDICEKILELEDFVQSCDIFAFNKV
jgi:elongation factor 1-beta